MDITSLPTVPATPSLSGLDARTSSLSMPGSDDLFASLMTQFLADATPHAQEDAPPPAPRPTPSVERPAARANTHNTASKAAERPSPRPQSPERPATRPAANERPAADAGVQARKDAAQQADESAADATAAAGDAATARTNDSTGTQDADAAREATASSGDNGNGEDAGTATTETVISEVTITETTVMAQTEDMRLVELMSALQISGQGLGIGGLALNTGANGDGEALEGVEDGGLVALQQALANGRGTGAQGGGAVGDGTLNGQQGPALHGTDGDDALTALGDGQGQSGANGQNSQAGDEFAALLQSARAATQTDSSGLTRREAAQAEQAAANDDAPVQQGEAQANRNTQQGPAAVAMAQGGPVGAGAGTQAGGGGHAVEGVTTTQGAERSGDAARQATHGGEGVRAGSNTDFASHVNGLKQLRGGTPQYPSVGDQITVQMQRGLQTGQDRMTIQLRPEELGRIDIRLEFGQDGRVAARVTADNPLTLELLQRDQRSLERALNDAGLKTDSTSLSFNLRGDGQNPERQNAQNEQSGSGSGNGRGGTAGNGDESVTEIANDLARGPVRTLRVANGRLDVRI